MDEDLLSRVRREIEERKRQLRPAVEEYGGLLRAAEQVGAPGARRSRAGWPGAGSRGGRAPRGAGQRAIVAALEHGSHTAGELAVVTAMPAASIRRHLRGLLQAGVVSKAEREGKPAYALSSPAG